MTSIVPNLKRASPPLLGEDDLYLSSSNATPIHREDDDELILPPVSSFMKPTRTTTTTATTTTTLSDFEAPVLPSLQELHLLPERFDTNQGLRATTTMFNIPLSIQTTLSTTPTDDNKFMKQKRQYRRRLGTGLAFSNSVNNSIIPQGKTQPAQFNLFDKPVEGFVGGQPANTEDPRRTSLDLLLLGEAAAYVEREEGVGLHRYASDQDVSMSSSLVPSSASTPQPPAQVPIMSLQQTTVPLKQEGGEVKCAPKIRVFESKEEQKGQAETGFGGAQEPRARRRSSAINKDSLYCHFCGRRNTPEWRKGPDGPATLCNACGLQWAKRQKMINNTNVTGGSTRKRITGSAYSASLKQGKAELAAQLPQTPLENTSTRTQFGTPIADSPIATTTLFQQSLPFRATTPTATTTAPYAGFPGAHQGVGAVTMPTSPDASLKSKLAVLSALSASVGIRINGDMQSVYSGHHRVGGASSTAAAGHHTRSLTPQEFASTLSTLTTLANNMPRSSSLAEELQPAGSLTNNVVVANKISNGSSPLK